MDSDLVSKTKSIYEVKAGEIFWKNFLAGFAKGLGGVFVYIVFLLILTGVIYKVVWPQLMPMITTYSNLIKSFESISNTKSGLNNLMPENLDLQKLLNQ